MNLIGAGEPQRVDAGGVTADLFLALGVQPLIGRRFTADDTRESAPGRVVLSYRVWQTTFGGDANVISRRVILDNEPFEVIGVMPRTFRFQAANVLL